MTELERQIIESRLAEIDRRRAEIEFMLSGMPYSPNACDDCVRHDLEIELRNLWAARGSLVKRQGYP